MGPIFYNEEKLLLKYYFCQFNFFFEGPELERLGNSTEISQRSGSYAPISRLLKHSRIGAFPSNHLSSTKTNYFTCFWHFNTLNSWSVAPAIPVIANLFQSDILPLFSVFNQRFLCINTLPKKKTPCYAWCFTRWVSDFENWIFCSFPP